MPGRRAAKPKHSNPGRRAGAQVDAPRLVPPTGPSHRAEPSPEPDDVEDTGMFVMPSLQPGGRPPGSLLPGMPDEGLFSPDPFAPVSPAPPEPERPSRRASSHAARTPEPPTYADPPHTEPTHWEPPQADFSYGGTQQYTDSSYGTPSTPGGGRRANTASPYTEPYAEPTGYAPAPAPSPAAPRTPSAPATSTPEPPAPSRSDQDYYDFPVLPEIGDLPFGGGEPAPPTPPTPSARFEPSDPFETRYFEPAPYEPPAAPTPPPAPPAATPSPSAPLAGLGSDAGETGAFSWANSPYDSQAMRVMPPQAWEPAEPKPDPEPPPLSFDALSPPTGALGTLGYSSEPLATGPQPVPSLFDDPRASEPSSTETWGGSQGLGANPLEQPGRDFGFGTDRFEQPRFEQPRFEGPPFQHGGPDQAPFQEARLGHELREDRGLEDRGFEDRGFEGPRFEEQRFEADRYDPRDQGFGSQRELLAPDEPVGYGRRGDYRDEPPDAYEAQTAPFDRRAPQYDDDVPHERHGGRRSPKKQPGMPGWIGIGVSAGCTAGAMVLDLMLTRSIGVFFGLCFVLTAFGVAAGVRRKDVFTAGVLPPLAALWSFAAVGIAAPDRLGAKSPLPAILGGLAASSWFLVAASAVALGTIAFRVALDRSEPPREEAYEDDGWEHPRR